MEYYNKNKEHWQQYARNNYHKNKLNPKSSCYIVHRLEIQRKAYLKKHPDRVSYNSNLFSRKLLSNEEYPIIIKKGNFIIKF